MLVPSAIADRVFRFDIDRINKELDWFPQNKIEFIFLSDMQINYSDRVNETRNEFWGRKVAKNIYFNYPPALEIHPNAAKENHRNICFVGQARRDSGLDLLLPLLPSLSQKFGIKLKIIGSSTPYRQIIETKINEQGLRGYVESYEWLPREKLLELMGDCFCGINLITDELSFSAYTVPGKILDYIQMLLPVLVTENIGTYAKIIKEDKLGCVVDSVDSGDIARKIEWLFKNQEKVRQNIKEHAAQNSTERIKGYLKMAFQSCEEKSVRRNTFEHATK